MKISEFASLFDIPINTIRFYVSCGLLLPEVRNKQFRFDARCVADMKLILQLKEFDFSIAEIQSILALVRLSNLTAEDDIEDLVHILNAKHAELTEKLAQSQKAIRNLERYIAAVRRKEIMETPGGTSGVPIEMLPLLCCPDCGKPLSMQNADIRRGQILEADISCDCGYCASIRNGILVTEGGWISQYDSPDVDRKFYKDLPVSWVTLFQKSFNWMLKEYKDMDLSGKVILETHINFYFFCFARIADMDRNAVYIFTDKYLEIVTLFKSLIERQNPDLKILYIADSTYRYPLRKECVDLYVDFCSLNEYSTFTDGENLFTLMEPYLKPDAKVLGTYFYFDPKSPSQKELLREYPDCAGDDYFLSFYIKAAREAGYCVEREEEIGFVTENGSANRNFTFHVGEDPMHMLSYLAKFDGKKQT